MYYLHSPEKDCRGYNLNIIIATPLVESGSTKIPDNISDLYKLFYSGCQASTAYYPKPGSYIKYVGLPDTSNQLNLLLLNSQPTSKEKQSSIEEYSDEIENNLSSQKIPTSFSQKSNINENQLAKRISDYLEENNKASILMWCPECSGSQYYLKNRPFTVLHSVEEVKHLRDSLLCHGQSSICVFYNFSGSESHSRGKIDSLTAMETMIDLRIAQYKLCISKGDTSNYKKLASNSALKNFSSEANKFRQALGEIEQFSNENNPNIDVLVHNAEVVAEKFRKKIFPQIDYACNNTNANIVRRSTTSKQATEEEIAAPPQKNEELEKLKAENKELKRNLGMMQLENQTLKRAAQKYVSQQDSIINELEILRTEISITKDAKQKQIAERHFAELLTLARMGKLEYEQGSEGKEINQQILDYRKKQKQMEDSLSEINKKNNTLQNTVDKLINETAEDAYDRARTSVKNAEKMKNWFGSNTKTKCEMLKQAKEAYDKATRLGKDCRSDIKELKAKYPKCFN